MLWIGLVTCVRTSCQFARIKIHVYDCLRYGFAYNCLVEWVKNVSSDGVWCLSRPLTSFHEPAKCTSTCTARLHLTHQPQWSRTPGWPRAFYFWFFTRKIGAPCFSWLIRGRTLLLWISIHLSSISLQTLVHFWSHVDYTSSGKN